MMMVIPILVLVGVPMMVIVALMTTQEGENQIKPMKVLIVDDDESSTLLLQKALKSVSGNVNIDIIQRSEEAVNTLANQEYDLVFMDHDMPGLKGPELMKKADEALTELSVSRRHITPIVTFTANRWQDWNSDSLRYMNVKGHMSKGSSFATMKTVLSDVVKMSLPQTAEIAA